MKTLYRSLLVATGALALGGCASPSGPTSGVPSGVPMLIVRAMAETAVAPEAAGEADDPAIFHDADSGHLWVLGTDKSTGLFVYDRRGSVVDAARVGRLNNVDVLEPTDGGPALVGASRRSADGSVNEPGDELVFFGLDPESGALERLSPGAIDTDLADPYGFTLTRHNGQAYAFVTSKTGALRQYALERSDSGGITGREIRRLALGSVSEGVVAAPQRGAVYVAEERVGIWRYGIEPASGNTRERVAAVDDRRLFADVEGLALAPRTGWLIASSQGSDHFTVYALDNHRFVGAFRVIGNEEPEIDTVTHTDGIDLLEADGTGYPGGLFVTHDDSNDGGVGQNYKYVPWQAIRDSLIGGRD